MKSSKVLNQLPQPTQAVTIDSVQNLSRRMVMYMLSLWFHWHNVRDPGRGELVFDQLRVLTPAQCLEVWT
jgi:hypothetical protein